MLKRLLWSQDLNLLLKKYSKSVVKLLERKYLKSVLVLKLPMIIQGKKRSTRVSLRKIFERAVKTIRTTTLDCNVKAKAYLFVKPILTSEKDAIEEAVKSAEYAESVGAGRISFCPATIHKDTLMELLWRGGSYQPPWIWSIMEIIKQVRKSLNIPIIMDTAGFGSRRGPYNCKKCNSRLKSMIIESNLNQSIPEDLECECKNKWKSEIEFCDITRSTTNLVRKK